MIYRELSNWQIDKVTVGLVFFVQRMDELLFDFTIDSHKPMALNSPSLCEEALRIIDEVRHDTVDRKNLEHIMDKLRSVLRRDIVAKKLLNASVEYHTGFNHTTSLDDLKLRIEVLERSLERYRYFGQLRLQLLEAVNRDRKERIDYLAKNMVTTLMNWGVSKRYLYHELHSFFYDNKNRIEDNAQLEEFLKRIIPERHRFTVYFSVSRNIALLTDSFKFFAVQQVDEKDIDKDVNDKLASIHDQTEYVLVKFDNVESADPYFARDMAESRLETMSNTSQLFFHKRRLKWKRRALVIQNCCENRKFLVNRSLNPMMKAFNHRAVEVSQKINWIFRNTALRGDSFQKFNRAIELHCNCLHNLSSENQIVNLWTLLETIVPPNHNKSKVQNVSDSIIPIISRNYFRKSILTLYRDCLNWDEDKTGKILEGLVDSDCTDLKRFAIFLMDPTLENARKQYYCDLGDFELLRNRIYRTSKILMSADTVLSELERHQNNVVWQIRRIYRTRNLIVHAGKTPLYIATLIENAHDYVDQTMTEIVWLSTSDYRVSSLEQSYELSKLLWKKTQNAIKEQKAYTDYIDEILTDVGI